MKKQVELRLGEEIQVLMVVCPVGLTNQQAMHCAVGATGGIVGHLISDTRKSPVPAMPGGRREAMYLALTPTRLVFFTLGSRGKFSGASPDLMVAEYVRTDVTGCVVRRGRMEIPFFMTRSIQLALADGSSFSMETLTPLFCMAAAGRLLAALK